MRTAAFILLGAAALSTVPAHATSVDDLFRQYGLFGTWAINCAQPASPANPRVNITTPTAGLVLEDHDLGPDFAVNHYSVLSAEPVSENRLSVEVIFQPGRELEEHQKLVFQIQNGTRRTIFNQPEGGAVRVKDGIALAHGMKTPVLKKCE